MPQPVSITPMPSNISIPVDYGITIPARGRSTSPIRPGPSMERLRRAPSRTFVPTAFPIDIIDFPQSLHPRIRLGIRVSAPVFMGGATAEGAIHIIVDGGAQPPRARRKLSSLSIDRLCVSLVGIERSGARQYMFRCLMTDLIDEAHPPPIEMARPNQPMSDQLWGIMPSNTILPFRLDLPVKLGPPPYISKKNSITYLISVLVEAKVDGMRAYVRESEEVTVLTVHDPEKALLNLPNPLVVTDEIQCSHRKSLETVKLTAGIHRQTWISGYPLFIDVRIANGGSKAVKRVELQLERSTFVYTHTAPADEEGLGAALLRMPDKCGKEILVKAIKHLTVQLPITIIHPNSIDIPPNCLAQVAATIEHKHRSRSPSTPDTMYKYRPGQAFIAARRQSFDEVARRTIPLEEVNELTTLLDRSTTNSHSQRPRRRASTSIISATTTTNPHPNPNANPNPPIAYRSSKFVEGTHSFRNSHHSNHHPPPTRTPPPRPPQHFNTFVLEKQPSHLPPSIPIPDRRSHHRASMDESRPHPHPPPHPHQQQQQQVIQHRRTRSSLTEKFRGPRLQRSTSGLGFESSEDEVEEGEREGGEGLLGVGEGGERARLRRRMKVVTESRRALRGGF
ncbi:hypothetical protein Q9189_007958 [Teloschistes chrysophthalmus]